MNPADAWTPDRCGQPARSTRQNPLATWGQQKTDGHGLRATPPKHTHSNKNCMLRLLGRVLVPQGVVSLCGEAQA